MLSPLAQHLPLVKRLAPAASEVGRIEIVPGNLLRP